MSKKEKPKTRFDEIAERYAAVGCTALKTALHTVKRPFSDERMKEMADDITTHVLRCKELEDEKKEYDKELKTQIDKEDAQAKALSAAYRAGFEELETACVEILDHSRNLVAIVELESGLEVATRVIVDSDLQTSMEIDPEGVAPEEKKPEKPTGRHCETPDVIVTPTPPAPLEVGYDGGNSDKGSISVGDVVVGDEEMTEGLEDLEGMTHVESDHSETVVDMVKDIHVKDNIAIIETTETTFFTDQQDLVDIAFKAKESKEYVKITFSPTNSRNQLMKSIEVNKPDEEFELPELEIPANLIDGADEVG